MLFAQGSKFGEAVRWLTGEEIGEGEAGYASGTKRTEVRVGQSTAENNERDEDDRTQLLGTPETYASQASLNSSGELTTVASYGAV